MGALAMVSRGPVAACPLARLQRPVPSSAMLWHLAGPCPGDTVLSTPAARLSSLPPALC